MVLQGYESKYLSENYSFLGLADQCCLGLIELRSCCSWTQRLLLLCLSFYFTYRVSQKFITSLLLCSTQRLFSCCISTVFDRAGCCCFSGVLGSCSFLDTLRGGSIAEDLSLDTEAKSASWCLRTMLGLLALRLLGGLRTRQLANGS